MSDALPSMSFPARRALTFTGTVALAIAVLACGGAADEAAESTEESAPAAEPAAPTASEGDGQPRVFFVEPEEGAEVDSPVRFVFGAENFAIEPVGDGAIHEGAGHYHVGLDTECLEPGVVIPQAAPWVHFGDGSSEFTSQFEPGEHTVCLQIGDGEHRTLADPGLSATVTFTVR